MKQYIITEISNGWLLETEKETICFHEKTDKSTSDLIFKLTEKILPLAILEITISD